LQTAYEESLAAVMSVRARRDALDAAVAEEAAKEPWAGVVGRLSCLRGVSTLTAFGLAREIGNWQRFEGRSIGAYLGLVPSESSSGERRRQGAITKTGNAHARRLLVEAAWHQRSAPRASRELARRREGQPAWYASVPPPLSAVCTVAGGASTRAASAPPWPPWPSPVSSPAGAGASR
jgi:transposase